MFFKNKSNTAKSTPTPSADISADILSSMKQFCPVVMFTPEGEIEDANPLFLSAMGYSLEEIKGKHHRSLCHPDHLNASEYSTFWSELAHGKSHSGTFLRRRKDGTDIWLEATYFPVFSDNKVIKVIKIASDITESYERSVSQDALLDAIDKSNAVIEFTPDGKVIKANDNFAHALGYRDANELRDMHHKAFCFEEFYQEQPNFWRELAHGEAKTGLFKRQRKDGSIVWIEASYNPVLGSNQSVVKVVKVAADITERVNKQLSIQRAAEVAHSTSVETAQVSERGAAILKDTVTNSQNIVADVKSSTDLIEDLNHQSDEISKIVDTIGSIADQTNLLALNAAIEAARAGEHGRGFAVVADEVRSLAARTSKSTDEVNEMVNKNTQLVAKAKESMVKVNAQAQITSENIQEASGIIDEIFKGAEHVSRVVGDLVESSDK